MLILLKNVLKASFREGTSSCVSPPPWPRQAQKKRRAQVGVEEPLYTSPGIFPGLSLCLPSMYQKVTQKDLIADGFVRRRPFCMAWAQLPLGNAPDPRPQISSLVGNQLQRRGPHEPESTSQMRDSTMQREPLGM
ncbi:uncharacterized protein AAES06_000944 [Glossophaga mutica]